MGLTRSRISPKNIRRIPNDIKNFAKIQLPRNLHLTDGQVQLHTFVDTSKIPYAATIYAHVTNDEGVVLVLLVRAKTRVTPIKIISIPQLELTAALLATRLLKRITQTRSVELNCYWTYSDSSIALAWLAKPPHTWKNFVANRVVIIQEQKIPWRHFRSKKNPANIASRGCCVSSLTHNTLSCNGPIRLSQPELSTEDLDLNESLGASERCKHHDVAAVVVADETINALFTRFSSLNHLINATCHLCPFFIWLKDNSIVKPLYISVDE